MTIQVRPGKLNTRVLVQRVTETRDSAGGLTEAWTTLADTWADIEPVSGREFWAASQQQGEVVATIKLRYLSGLRYKDRITEKHSGKTWDIERVLDLDNRRRVQMVEAVNRAQ